jgi:hypothetical protein
MDAKSRDLALLAKFQIFIQASSPEIWRKTIFGGEGGCWRGKWGGLFWATSLEKIFGGVIAIITGSSPKLKMMGMAVYRLVGVYTGRSSLLALLGPRELPAP